MLAPPGRTDAPTDRPEEAAAPTRSAVGLEAAAEPGGPALGVPVGGELDEFADALGLMAWEAEVGGRLDRPEERRYVHVSPGATRLLGFAVKRWREEPGFWVKRLHPDDRDRVLAALRSEVSPGRRLELEYRLVAADGRAAPVREVLVASPAPGGRGFQLRGLIGEVGGARRTEEALRETERRLRTVVDGAPIILVAIDRDGTITLSEGHGLGALGLRPGEHVGRSVFELYRDQPFVVEAVRRGLAGETFTGSGGIAGREYDFRFSPIRDARGELAGTMAVATEVTERKRAEEALRATQELLHAVVTRAPLIVAALDLEGAVTLAEGRGLETLGSSPGLVVGRSIFDVVPDMPQRAREALRRALTGEALTTTLDLRGSAFEIHFSPLHDGDGRLVGTSAIGVDVTERTRAREALRRSEASLALAQRIAQLGSWDLDLATRRVHASEEAYRIFGRPPGGSLTERVFYRLIHPDDRERIQRAMREAVAGLAPYRVEYRVVRPDGEERILRSEAEVLRDREGRAVRIAGTVHDVTEQRRAEEALRASEQRFRLLTENARDVIYRYRLGPEAGFEYISPSVTAMTGYTPEEHYADPELELKLVHPEDRARLVAFKEGRLSFEEPLVLRWHRRDGSLLWTEERATPVCDQAGRPVAIDVVARDITDRVRTEEGLRRSEANLASAQRIARLGSWEWTLASGEEYWSAEIRRMFGLAPGEPVPVGEAFYRWIHPHDQAPLRAAIRTAIAECAPYTVEYRIVRPDGTERTVQERAEAVADEAGRAVRLVGTVHDITERARAEAEHARLSAAVEQTAEAVMITEPDGTIVYVNAAFERMSGYTRAEAVGQAPRLVKSGRHDDAYYRTIWETLGRGEAWTGTLVNRRKDGALFETEAVINPLRDTAGRIVSFVEVARDVTAERSLEAQLRQAQKMEAIGRLAGGMAHDFNNVLTAISGYGELLLGDLGEDDPRQVEAREIFRAAQRAGTLTRQLLAFSRRQVLSPRVLDLNAVVADMRRMLRRLISEEIRLIVDCAPDLEHVRADPGQLEQVIVNLVLNARDAMPDGGTLTISTASIELHAARLLEHPAAEPGRYAMLEVRDTGVGMDAETQAHLFEPFFTTKEPGKGTGLGLATAYGIVRQSGGYIWADSEPGRGSTFRVYLPRVEAPLDAPAARQLRLPPPRSSGTILLVEDDAVVRSLTRDVLGRRGYTVAEAADGPGAMRLAETMETIDLLVTDVVLPGLSGRAVADRLREGRPRMCVLFMSGYADEAIVRHGVLGEGIGFIQKPFTPDSLVRRVQEVLEVPAVPPRGG